MKPPALSQRNKQQSIANEPANISTFREGIERLTTEDWSKLWAIAAARGNRSDADDLIQEVIARTLAGKRHYNPKVPLMAFLIRSMKGIAFAWNKRNRKHVSLKDTALTYLPGIEAQMMNEEALCRHRDRLGDDRVAREVLGLWRDGRTSLEIQALLCINAHTVDAARKRFFRKARTLGGKH